MLGILGDQSAELFFFCDLVPDGYLQNHEDVSVADFAALDKKINNFDAHTRVP